MIELVWITLKQQLSFFAWWWRCLTLFRDEMREFAFEMLNWFKCREKKRTHVKCVQQINFLYGWFSPRFPREIFNWTWAAKKKLIKIKINEIHWIFSDADNTRNAGLFYCRFKLWIPKLIFNYMDLIRHTKYDVN